MPLFDLSYGFLYPPNWKYLNAEDELLDAPTLVWDGDTSDASPDFTSITLDLDTPVGSYLYVEFSDDTFATVTETATPIALTENQINNVDPIALTVNDLTPGSYKARAYTKDPTNTNINSGVSDTVDITVAAAGITFVGYKLSTVPQSSQATYTIGTTSLSGGIGGDVQDGDTIILSYGSTSAGDLAISVDNHASITFTEVAELFADDSNDTNLAVAVGTISGTPPATFTINGTANTANGQVAILRCYRNVNATIQDVAATTAQNGNTTIADGAAITPVTSGARVVAVYACAAPTGNTIDFATPGVPSGWENFTSLSNTGGSTRYVAMCTFDKAWTSGALDPPALDPGDNPVSGSWAAITIALRPA